MSSANEELLVAWLICTVILGSAAPCLLWKIRKDNLFTKKRRIK